MPDISQDIYDELRRLAGGFLRHERSDHTLQATALVHEAFLKLRDRLEAAGTIERSHFIAAAAQAMRRILVDHARARKRIKRGDPSRRADIDPDLLHLPNHDSPADLESLDVAVKELELADPAAARIVELRFFSGLSVDEAAVVMNLSPRSAARLWQFARSWLYQKLSTP